MLTLIIQTKKNGSYSDEQIKELILTDFAL
jgi:hypothetical protein